MVAALAYMMSTEEAQAFVARLNMPSAWAEAVMGMARLASDVPRLEDPDLSPSMLYRALEGRPMASIDALVRSDTERCFAGEADRLFGESAVCATHSAWRRFNRIGSDSRA